MITLFGKKWYDIGIKPLSNYPTLLAKTMQDDRAETHRPVYDPFRRVQRKGVQFPIIPVSMIQIYNVARLSSVVRTSTDAIRDEIFRRGLHLENKFTRKCYDCSKEYEEDVEYCPDCGSLTEVASEGQRHHWTKFFDRCNENEQSLEDVLMTCEDDLNVIDDAYLICIKKYHWVGDKLYSRVVEIIRGDPAFMRIVADEGGRIGNVYWTCLEHRTLQESAPGNCPECGHPLFDVTHVMTDGGITPTYNYIAGEVLHWTKYHKSMLYGVSPLITLWKETTTLLNMNEYVNDYYRERQHPKGVVAAVGCSNAASVQAAWEAAGDYAHSNPHYVPIVAVESETGRGRMDFISFTDTLKEMDYTASRDELRDRISAFYGVSKILMNDVSTGGGLNNEGLQITVTNRRVASSQRIYKRTVFPWLERQLNMTDWYIELLPSEEEDEMAELQREAQELSNVKAKVDLGYEAELDEKGKWKFEKKDKAEEKPRVGGEATPPTPAPETPATEEGE